MTVIDLIREQVKSSHELMESTISGVSDEVVHFNETNKALPVGAAYAHAVISEDVILSTMILKTAPLSSDNLRTGLSIPMTSFSEWDKYEEWVKSVKIDLPKLQSFAQEVYGATDKYLASLTDADLEKEIDTGGMGKYTLSHLLTNFIILHNASLAGEVSAAKGFQGHKGYPF